MSFPVQDIARAEDARQTLDTLLVKREAGGTARGLKLQTPTGLPRKMGRMPSSLFSNYRPVAPNLPLRSFRDVMTRGTGPPQGSICRYNTGKRLGNREYSREADIALFPLDGVSL